MSEVDISGTTASDLKAAYEVAADYIETLLDNEELEAEVETQLALEDDFANLFLLGVKYGKEEANKASNIQASNEGLGCAGGDVHTEQGQGDGSGT